jgi:hypothetical protein
MYVIIFKLGPNSSWVAEHRIYEDREKADIRKHKLLNSYHKVEVCFVKLPI